MESAAQVSSALNLNVLKEPRGFIKCLEWILSIFAFATTTSFTGHVEYHSICNTTTYHRKFDYSYPFALDSVGFPKNLCLSDGSNFDAFHYLKGNAVSSSQFYVFVGVIVFLYCIGALILYIFFDDLYRKNTRIVIIDFIVSIVLTALWLISSSAWAQGVTDVKYYSDPDQTHVFDSLAPCNEGGNSNKLCSVDSLGNFASLNISVIFGFLNFLVWGGNLWFLWKETPWFKVTAKPPSAPDAVPSPTLPTQY